MRLRANVTHSTGNTRHYRASIDDTGGVRKDRELPPPAAVEIQPADDCFFLLCLDRHGECQADTWHQTLRQAKDQARYEFGIEEDAWELVEPDEGLS